VNAKRAHSTFRDVFEDVFWGDRDIFCTAIISLFLGRSRSRLNGKRPFFGCFQVGQNVWQLNESIYINLIRILDKKYF